MYKEQSKLFHLTITCLNLNLPLSGLTSKSCIAIFPSLFTSSGPLVLLITSRSGEIKSYLGTLKIMLKLAMTLPDLK